MPRNVSRKLLLAGAKPRGQLFHALNQRAGLAPGNQPDVVVTFHDLFVMTGDYSTPEFRQRFTAQAKQAASRADLIIAVSKFTANQVRDLLNFPPARIRVVPHGVHAPKTMPPDDELRENIILHVGAIQKRKNIARLVEAFEQVTPDWRLILAGSAGFDAQAIQERIDRSFARPRITVTGYLHRHELIDLYLRSRVLAFPSLDEGFGIPALEAMAYGLAVVASDRSALPEVCGRAALLVNPLDVDSIAQGLRRVTSDDALRVQYQTMGRSRAPQFPWQRAVEETWAVYGELL